MIFRRFWAGSLRLLGAALALVSCVPMLAMLPAGFVAVVSLIGLTSPPVVAGVAPLAPVAPWLFGVSVVLLTMGHARCGWQPAGLAAVGGLLVYLAMYVLVGPVVMDAMTGMEGMIASDAAQTAMTGLTNAPLFYLGLTLMVASFGLVGWRRRRGVCHPFNPLALLRSAREG